MTLERPFVKFDQLSYSDQIETNFNSRAYLAENGLRNRLWDIWCNDSNTNGTRILAFLDNGFSKFF